MAECLQLDLPLKQFAKIIKAENLNSYEGTKLHPDKNFAYKARIEINALESLMERSGIELPEAKTISPKRAGEDDLQAVRSIGEVVERLGVGPASVRMIDPRDNPPGAAGSNSPGALRRRRGGAGWS